MENRELYEKELGSEGALKVEVLDGKLLLSLAHASKGADASLLIKVSPRYLLDQLKGLIPGQLDDSLIDAIVKALELK